MIDIEKLKDGDINTLITNKWNSSSSLWKIVEDEYKKNYSLWQNSEKLGANIPIKKSKTTANRVHIVMESVIASLTARPSKPNVLPANQQPESGAVASDLQDLFLEIYRKQKIKRKMIRGLRWVFLARMICLKVVWDGEKDDFTTEVVDPRKVRFAHKATNAYETDFAIEEIDTTVEQMLLRFPDKKDEILKRSGGGKEERSIINQLSATYKECWINGGEWVVYQYQGRILKKERNPYWDWDGVLFNKNELRTFALSENLTEKKRILGGARKARSERMKESEKYTGYLLNHFDRPMHPYIFDTLLAVQNAPVGETSRMQQARSLQNNVNKRKQQISDNASEANGRWKIDTKYVEGKTKGEFQAMKSDPGGLIMGDGVKDGVTIESGRDLPAIVREDMLHSIQEIDAIFGSMPTFRGEGGQKETATGRAILREQSFMTQNEPIDMVDEIHSQLYNWWMQMIRVNYTEKHLIKVIGRDRTTRVIEVLGDNIEDGIEVRVIPGQILPKDRVFRSERALEAVKLGILYPLAYFEEAEFDNPMETAKKLEMYKANPFSILDMDKEDIERLAKSFQLLKEIQQEAQPTDQRAQAISNLRAKTQELVESPEFQEKPPEEQQRVLNQLKGQFKNLIGAGQAQKE